MTLAFVIDSVPFTKGIIAGDESLGGSESACLGLARALARRHAVHIFTTQLADECAGTDHAGVAWHPFSDFWPMQQFVEWDAVIALRLFPIFGTRRVNARLRVLWNQDLLVDGSMKLGVMASSFQIDKVAYVSEFHRKQWEELLPDLKGLGWVTKNGFDPALVPTDVVKDPTRIIHVSRPERGLKPLLQMWPAMRKVQPDATLALCRYSSMYDPGPNGWGEVCKDFDAQVARVNAEVGGIEFLGELGKPELYRQIAKAAVMWYPGVANFAETSCIAAIEAQACGTPFIGSYKGGLLETAKPSLDAGLLLPGDAEKDQAYQVRSIQLVREVLKGCRDASFAYRKLQGQGRQHVTGYTYDVVAAEWEAAIHGWFAERSLGSPIRILRQLLHEDDHTAAKALAKDIGGPGYTETEIREVEQAADFCDYVIAGKDHTAEDYAEHALDTLQEADTSLRFGAVAPRYEQATRVLDVACGNGSFAIALARANPTVHVIGIDYAQQNIDRAIEAAQIAGVADRVSFRRVTVYDFDAQALHQEWFAFVAATEHLFDGLFCGEFLEHCGNYQAVIDGLEAPLSTGATVVFTVPNGNLIELIGRRTPVHRGHVHRFAFDDVAAVFGPKKGWRSDCLAAGLTTRGTEIGNWLISYTVAPNRKAGARPIAQRITRTRPNVRLSVGLIVKNAATDLARCLESVWPIADEIVVGDTGSTDETIAIAESFKARVLRLPTIEEHEDGFAGARNAVLDACAGEWFLWIDADEVLTGAEHLRKYIETGPYRGFAIHQNHLTLDLPVFFDKPVRLFKRDGNIRFFGCIHEQPGDGDPNTDITPALELDEVQIAHTGYMTESVRRYKMFSRNLPLLIKDRERFPERRLGLVLVLRDHITIADQDRADHGGKMTIQAWALYRQAIELFDAQLSDPADKLHALARPWYERAVAATGQGWEIEVALAGKAGGMKERHAKPERVWVRTSEEFDRLMKVRLDEVHAKMHPKPLRVDPFPEDDVLARTQAAEAPVESAVPA